MSRSPGRHFPQIPGPTNASPRIGIRCSPGEFGDASALGTLAAVEIRLKTQYVPFGDGAVEAAIEVLSDRRVVMAEAAE